MENFYSKNYEITSICPSDKYIKNLLVLQMIKLKKNNFDP